MLSFQYKGRIHKAKFSARSLRYVLSDRAARLFPALQRRWLFPVEAVPIARAATGDISMPSIVIGTALPPELKALGNAHDVPLQVAHHLYAIPNATVTGWAGATICDGRMLALRPQPNWVSALRARPHRLRTLSGSRAYYNLMAPVPALGHIFHWTFDGIVPLLGFLETRKSDALPGLLLNAGRREFQHRTLAYLMSRYGIEAIEEIAPDEAVHVPHLLVPVPVPHTFRALQAAAGIAALEGLADYLCGSARPAVPTRRLYVSRNDAKLRRVLNEREIQPLLEANGFEIVVLRGMPIAKQVALFRDANTIVAPHGAGLAHTAWCVPGTRIVEFFPNPSGPRGRPKNSTSDYWLIAKMRGLAYSCHFGSPSKDKNDGFEIGKDALAAALASPAII